LNGNAGPQPASDTRGGEEFAEGGPKFYIDSVYENNSYPYSFKLCPTQFCGGDKKLRPS